MRCAFTKTGSTYLLDTGAAYLVYHFYINPYLVPKLCLILDMVHNTLHLHSFHVPEKIRLYLPVISLSSLSILLKVEHDQHWLIWDTRCESLALNLTDGVTRTGTDQLAR